MAKSKRPKKRAANGYFWDKLIAGIAIVMDVLGLALGGAAVRYGFFDPKVIKADQPKILGGLGVILLALGLIYLVIHFAMFSSRRWSFIVLALLSGYGLYSGSVGPSAFMLTFTVLRLGKVFGPDLN